MFQHTTRRPGGIQAALAIIELIYHATVRSVRSKHGNAIVALLLNMTQAMTLVAAFYLMFMVLGLRGAAIRGNFLLYIMSGIFLFMTHTKAVGAVMGSDGPSAPMMKHAPMNTAIAITSSALAALYVQVLSLLTVLFIYHVGFEPITIQYPAAAFGMVLLSWVTGVAVGLVLLALKPWAPSFITLFSTIYQRANMIASGKMFVANTLPASMLVMFDWNPLFHCIDQARGFVFINYNPFNSSVEYPVIVAIVLLMVGLMGEFYTRRHVSVSWGARR